MAFQAANYLNIKELLDLTCLTVANMIKGTYTPCASVHSLCVASVARAGFQQPRLKTNPFSRFVLLDNR